MLAVREKHKASIVSFLFALNHSPVPLAPWSPGPYFCGRFYEPPLCQRSSDVDNPHRTKRTTPSTVAWELTRECTRRLSLVRAPRSVTPSTHTRDGLLMLEYDVVIEYDIVNYIVNYIVNDIVNYDLPVCHTHMFSLSSEIFHLKCHELSFVEHFSMYRCLVVAPERQLCVRGVTFCR